MARSEANDGDNPYDIIQKPASSAASRRSTPFQEAHQLQYGLRISERSPSDGVVISVACRFCISFGREEKVGAKRKQTANTKYFKKPFRPEHYRQHLVSQHPNRWASYKKLTQGGQRTYFDDVKPLRASILGFANETQAPIVTYINRDIIDVIVNQVLLDDDDTDMSWQQTITTLPLDDSNSHYILSIKNPVQFYLIVDYLSVGMSFRMALATITKTKNRTGLASIGSCTPGLPSKYARYVCAMNLQKITQILSQAWTFSLALDMSTHMSISYLDTRIRVYHDQKLINLHLLAIPMGESHNASAMFDAVTQVLDVICANWKDIMLGITTDGEPKMTGKYRGLATRFQNVCAHGFTRVWCGLHQLDLALQKAFKAVMNTEFYGYLTQVIAHLRCQHKLIRQMETTCPLLQGTRWESMGRCCNWFKTHRVELTAFLKDTNSVSKPPDKWWLVLSLVDKLASRAVITFRSLEGRSALITEQEEEFKRLSADLQGRFGACTVDSPDHVELEGHVYSDERTIFVDPTKIFDILWDDGGFSISIINSLDFSTSTELTKDFAAVIANLIECIRSISPERDENNAPMERELPPLLPSDFAGLKGRELSALISTHRDRMLPRWRAIDIDKIEQEHSELCELYRRQEAFRQSIDRCTESASSIPTFEDSWKAVDKDFPMLRTFAGGLATTFPGTSTVESDFSHLKMEKPPSKSRLTNFSLEGALHTQQFNELEEITMPENKPGETDTAI